jgi:hypothetical protein
MMATRMGAMLTDGVKVVSVGVIMWNGWLKTLSAESE